MSLDLRGRRRRAQPRPARLGLRVQAPDRHRREDRRQGDPRRRVPPPRPRQGRVRRRARAVVQGPHDQGDRHRQHEGARAGRLVVPAAAVRRVPPVAVADRPRASTSPPSAASSACSTAASVDELRRSLGTNVYDDILFPADPVKDAPRIIGRLRTVFPVEPSGLVVGPTVEINWGTPAIVKGRFADPRPVRRRVRRRRLPLHPADDPRHGPGDGAAARGRRAAARRAHRRRARRLRLRVRPHRHRRPAARLEARRRRVQRLAADPHRHRQPARRSPSPPVGSIRRSPTCRRRCPLVSTGSALRWQVGSSVTFTLQAYVAITASSWQLGAALSIVAKLGPVDLDGRVALRRHRLRRRPLQRRARPLRADPLARSHADVGRGRRRPRPQRAAGLARRRRGDVLRPVVGQDRRLRAHVGRRAVAAAGAGRRRRGAGASRARRRRRAGATQLPQGGEALVTLASVADHRRAGPSARHADRVAARGSARAAPRPRRRPAGGAGHRRRRSTRSASVACSLRHRRRRWRRSRGPGSRTSPRTSG